MGSAVFALQGGTAALVVKIYPDVARASMRKELWVCDFLAQHAPTLPVPKVLAADESGLLLPYAFSVLTRLPGVYLRSILDLLTEDDLVAVYEQLARTLQTLHAVELAEFGEVMPGRGTRYGTNRRFMHAQFRQALETFSALGGDRTLHRQLRTYLLDGLELLDRASASFCHNDAHDANILVERSPHGWVLSGVLDFEHALAGDPLLDLAKSFYFAPSRSDGVLTALTDGVSLKGARRGAFDTYLVYHQLQLWNLLAGLGVASRLPAIAENLQSTIRSR